MNEFSVIVNIDVFFRINPLDNEIIERAGRLMHKIAYENMEYLKLKDNELFITINNEFHRQQNNIELIASENIVSLAVIAAMASVVTNKYAAGYSGKRYYGDVNFINQIETLAIERAKQLFNCTYANIQPFPLLKQI